MTIALEHIADGSVVARNFELLMGLVPDTGGVSVSIRYGRVSAAGAILAGQGFTVTKGAAGLYTINQTWPRAPVVIASLGSTSSITGIAVTPDPTTAGFGIATFNGAGLINAMFQWFAIG